MVLHTRLFPSASLRFLNDLSWALIHPCYWLLDHLVASFLTTTQEQRQCTQDPCASLTPCVLLVTPLYLLLAVVWLPVALLGFLVWAPLQAVRRPYAYGHRRTGRAEKGWGEWKAPGRRSFGFASANVCLLPDSLARFNNLADTQGRACELGRRIFCGVSRPRIRIYVDSPTSSSVCTTSSQTFSLDNKPDVNGREDELEGGVEPGLQNKECVPLTGQHAVHGCPLHSTGPPVSDCRLHSTGHHTFPDCPLYSTRQPNFDCPLHSTGHPNFYCPLHSTGHPNFDCPLHYKGQPIPDCPLHSTGQPISDCPLHSTGQPIPDCLLHSTGQPIPDCPLHSTGQPILDCPLHSTGQPITDCSLHSTGQPIPDCPLHSTGQPIPDCLLHLTEQHTLPDCPLHSRRQHAVPFCPLHSIAQPPHPDCPVHSTEQPTTPDCALHPSGEQTLPDCHLHSLIGQQTLPDCTLHSPIGQQTPPDCPLQSAGVQISISDPGSAPKGVNSVPCDSCVTPQESLTGLHRGNKDKSNGSPSDHAPELKKCARPRKRSVGDGLDHEVSAFFPANLDFLCLQEVFDRQAAVKLKQQLHHYFPFILSDVGRYAWKGCCSQFKFLNSGLMLASQYPILDADYHCFPNGRGEDALAAKGVLFAKVQVGKSSQGKSIVGYIACTHLHSIEGDSVVRCEQLNMLLEYGAYFRKATKRQKDQVAFEVLLGDLNFDNCSSEDKLEQQHILFSHYKDPCRVGPGEDQPWALGTLLEINGLYDEEVCTPERMQKVMENEEGRNEYLAYPPGKKHCFDQEGQAIPLKGNGRRIDYILYSEEGLQQDWKVGVEEYSFITQLAGLTDHLAVAMRLAVSMGEEEL
ncbi:sphingomyelin phosphodiesterase 3-like [Anguilla anguilla]|uniref:sphingomyelin phosphodiesterase 3-like n=1 Tax=Anguilla anguilla TaxID=7936 RepID=UPI0015AADB95|nr:sphingomyelin phosphodiesterase 3-like [Anguilla anguilla]